MRFQRLLHIAIAVLLLAGTGPLRAQEDGITIGTRARIHSTILKEDRTLLISLPPDYADRRIRCPVIYLLDGSALFLQTVADARFLASQGMAPAMIIVAIENTDRTRDFTPPSSKEKEKFPTSGGADRFREFLVKELRPYLESNYRTEPYSILIGWSFGGLFAVHTLMEEPEAFGAYLAISPSLWWDSEAEGAKAERGFASGAGIRKFLYLTHGRENNGIPKSVQAFTTILGLKAPALLRWKFDYLSRDNHQSTPPRAIYDGLESLFDGWALPEDRVPGVAEMERQFSRLTEAFGFPCRPSEGRLNRRAYGALQRKKTEEAIALFHYIIRLYPESPNAYDSLAEAYLAAGEPALALENCRSACRLGEKYSDPNLPVFLGRLESVRKMQTPSN